MTLKYENLIFFKISSRAVFAYSRYWLHKHQSVMQFDRVQSAIHERSLISQNLDEPDINQPDAMRLWHHFGSSINKKILAEIHLFFIAVDNTKDMINVILSEDTLVHLKESLGKYIHSMEHYTHGRNTFEHFDDRIPGGAKHNKVKEIKENGAGPRRILGGLRGNIYPFGDKEWELSPNKFQKIMNGMESFEKSLHSHLDTLNENS